MWNNIALLFSVFYLEDQTISKITKKAAIGEV